jgi:alcohol dehydrogenase
MSSFENARRLILEFKGDSYVYGFGALEQAGSLAGRFGSRAVLVHGTFPGAAAFCKTIVRSMESAGLQVAGTVPGAGPNAPREDVSRIAASLEQFNPDVVVSFGGGSTIDAVKAASVLRALGGPIDDYFGTNLVTRALASKSKILTPHVAIQTAASSGAHLTKYSNVTDLKTGQKKLIVDMAVVPAAAVFDYRVTLGAPPALTADGAFDGTSHVLEVLYSAVGKPIYARMEEVAAEAIRLVLEFLPRVMADPFSREGREALALATDLGAYAIMLGGTNGAHLTSFSLVDILSHGRACIMLNPYYTVFFAPAVESALRLIAPLLQQAGCAEAGIARLSGRELGEAVARALMAFEKKVGVPTTLSEVPGFNDGHIGRALSAAKDPQLRMKLENMPVPLTAEMVDDYMGPVLAAAATGDLSRIRNVPAP